MSSVGSGGGSSPRLRRAISALTGLTTKKKIATATVRKVDPR
jgi:hypothetical protein